MIGKNMPIEHNLCCVCGEEARHPHASYCDKHRKYSNIEKTNKHKHHGQNKNPIKMYAFGR